MSDVKIGISLELATGWEQVVDALSKVSQHLKSIQAASGQLPSALGGISRGFSDIAQSAEKIPASQAEEMLRRITETGGGGFREFARIMREQGVVSSDLLTEAWWRLKERGELTREEITAMARESQFLSQRLGQLRLVNDRFTAMLGPTGSALLSLSRSLFWVGLGTMFAMMSFARLLRQQAGLERQSRNLAAAYRDEREALQEASDAILLYGRNSEEAQTALERAADAHDRVIDTEEALREAVEQTNLSMMMWVFGTVPTAIRSATSLASDIWKLVLAQFAHAASSGAEADAQGVASGAMAAHQLTVFGLTISYKGLAIAMGVATAGFSILLGLLAMSAAESKMNELQNKALEGSYKSVEERLTGHSLVDSLKEATVATRELGEESSRAFRNLTLGLPNREISISLNYEVQNPPEIPESRTVSIVQRYLSEGEPRIPTDQFYEVMRRFQSEEEPPLPSDKSFLVTQRFSTERPPELFLKQFEDSSFTVVQRLLTEGELKEVPEDQKYTITERFEREEKPFQVTPMLLGAGIARPLEALLGALATREERILPAIGAIAGPIAALVPLIARRGERIPEREERNIVHIGPNYINATVRSEEDVRAIAREIDNLRMRDSSSYGGVIH